ncbi:MAG: cryptochrome/photolyase family protein [Alphaproteobacteria bacterium]|nr:cryptochrome/photolyase family protein [Alphaproteobacteria bacterium]
MTKPSLVLILGDQLSPTINSLGAADPRRDRVLMVEVEEEATYVKHHKKKIAFLFSAMRHFAETLRRQGWTVDYVQLDDPENSGSFSGEIGRAVARLDPARILVTEPGEWRVRAAMETWTDAFQCPVEILDDDWFLCSRRDFADWAVGRKQLRMEHFYRAMRRKAGLLMDGDGPAGGKWNFDAANRKPASTDLFMPEPARFDPDDITREVLDLVRRRFAGHFGDLEPFWFAVTAEQAEAALDRFIEATLPSFGDFQDAMLTDERFLYHSVLSLYINAGLLDPRAVCQRVAAAYDAGSAPLNAAEGFIRQIIGWREYVRGLYWLKMPGYADMNYFGAARPLPDFYWTGETEMACLRAAITQTKEEAYAHHIQRLMVTGNFAMLAGIDPRAVHEWYLMVYADAYEWVELPNTLGMSQFADGGLLGSKPYAASGNYINRMSDYCGHCRFDVKRKTGDGACPFNALYWDFLIRNEEKLRGNPRLSPVYRTRDRIKPEKQAEYRESAAAFLNML